MVDPYNLLARSSAKQILIRAIQSGLEKTRTSDLTLIRRAL